MDSSFGNTMHEMFHDIDMSIFSFFGHIQNDFLNFCANLFSSMGSEFVCVLFGLIACFMFLFKRTRKLGIQILFVIAIIAILNNVYLKYSFARMRPYNMLQANSEYFNWYLGAGAVPESPYSFPSGHSAVSMGLSIVVFVFLIRRFKNPLPVLILILPILIAGSRIYFMVHYPTDVIAGLIEGLFAAIVVLIFTAILDKILSWVPKLSAVNDKLDLERAYIWKFGKAISTKLAVSFILVLCCISIGLSFLYNCKVIYGQKNKCEFKSNDYICLNKTHEYQDEDGNPHYYCDIHKK